jgi:predicted solute-binding protein
MYDLASSWYGMSRNSLCLGFIVSKEKSINKALDRDKISKRSMTFRNEDAILKTTYNVQLREKD